MGTDNPITDENDEDEMMTDFTQEENEEAGAEVSDNDANIDGDADNMTEEQDYCNHSQVCPHSYV